MLETNAPPQCNHVTDTAIFNQLITWGWGYVSYYEMFVRAVIQLMCLLIKNEPKRALLIQSSLNQRCIAKPSSIEVR